MDNCYKAFSRQELCVILDALAFYMENEKKRQESVVELRDTFLQRLENVVIASQLDEARIDERDTIFSIYKLICKKSDILASYNQEAKKIYIRLLEHLEREM